MTNPLNASKGDTFAGAPSFSVQHRLERMLFKITWLLLARWTPPQMRRWRIVILRVFGASIHSTANIYASVKIWYPRNLVMGAYSSLGPEVNCYCMGQISLGTFAVVSQRAHLCCGSHDISQPDFQLTVATISVGDNAWICAEAFVGPNVIIGEGAVLAARAVTFTELNPWTVYQGNAAKVVKPRPKFER